MFKRTISGIKFYIKILVFLHSVTYVSCAALSGYATTNVKVVPRTEYKAPTARILVRVRRRYAKYWDFWQLNSNICPPSLCSASDGGTGRQRPHGTGGSVFYNGDIVLDKESERMIWGDNRRRKKRATIKVKNRLWPGGILYYTLSNDLHPLARRGIRNAMKHISAHTCIQFKKKRNKNPDYVRFISEPGCWSLIGKVGGEQKLSLGRGCERTGTAIHEILHALGIWHEQSRPDRDEFVKVVLDNVTPRFYKDFEKLNASITTSRGFPYDYGSVMHYSERSFTNTGGRTIRVVGVGKELGLDIGQREGLSNLDIAQIRAMYFCNEKEDASQTVCPKGWVKNRNSCYKFVKNPKYQFAAASKFCAGMKGHLVHINAKFEDTFIKQYLQKNFKNTLVWRTGGRKIKKDFVWDTGKKNKYLGLRFTEWSDGFPGTFSSLALVRNKTDKDFHWKGVWTGSLSQFPEHGYAFICERESKRKCQPLEHKDGRDYRGTLDHTIDGVTCQNWTSFYPQKHKLLPAGYTGKYNRDGLGQHNYCRNPDGHRRRRPWCFVTKKLNKKQDWQYCDVRTCVKKTKKSPNDIPGSQRKETTDSETTRQTTNKKKNKRKESDKNPSGDQIQNETRQKRTNKNKNTSKDKVKSSKKSKNKNKNKRKERTKSSNKSPTRNKRKPTKNSRNRKRRKPVSSKRL